MVQSAFTHSFSILFVGVIHLVGAGCTPVLTVTATEPGPVNLGRTASLRLVHGGGLPGAQDAVAKEVVRQAKLAAHYIVVEPPKDYVEVRRTEGIVTVRDGSITLRPGELGMQLDVLEWRAGTLPAPDSEAEASKEILAQGAAQPMRGNVTVRVTAFNHHGRVLVADKRYEGRFVATNPNVQEEQALEAATVDAVRQLMSDITPREVVRRLRMDGADSAQKEFIDKAKGGNIAQAAKGLQQYLRMHPDNPAAAYNLAVLMEATGEYPQALILYDRALGLAQKQFYAEGRAACARRAAQLDPVAANTSPASEDGGATP